MWNESFRHCLASLGNTKEKCSLLLSRCGGEIFLEKGKDIFLWYSALKVSGRWRNNADEVLAKLFFGERICQNFGSFVFEFGCRKWKRRGLGRNFPFAPLFVLGEFGADKKTEIQYCAFTILLFFVPDLKGVHPRHSPRTFPLGLLAPRCLGLALLLAIARLRAGGSGAMLFGGRKESFPQLRLVSAGLDQPAQPTPFLVFKIAFVVSLPLRISMASVYGGAHPLVMDALAEMSEAQMQMRLHHHQR